MSTKSSVWKTDRKFEPDEDYIENVMKCQQCWTYHFTQSGRCPECGAGIYHQISPPKSEIKLHCAREALQSLAKRRFFKAISTSDDETLKWMQKQLERELS